jgi:hypothetical protein
LELARDGPTEPCLADAARPHERHEADVRGAQQKRHALDLVLAADRRGRQNRQPPASGWRTRLERFVLDEDRALELLQRATGLEPELAAEQAARLAIDLERMRLTTRAVQSTHQLFAQPLLQRIGGD